MENNFGLSLEDEFNRGTIIKVIGVGGGGGNAVLNMIDKNVQGVEFINANTDAQALLHVQTHRVLQLGKSGLGAGSRPEKGRDAALSAEDEIRKILEGTHMLFITAGMGGGTGTGAAPVIAQIAKDMGILTVGVVTKPFEWEGHKRMRNAEEGLKELEKNVDSLIVVLNENLLSVYGEDITQEEAFVCANDILKNAVGGISEIINEYGQINVDFEDIKTVMSEPGRSMMGTALAKGANRAETAAEEAITCPLLEGVDLACAKGVLVLISASRGSLKLNESKAVMSAVNKYASKESHIIYGAAYDDSLGDQIRVTVIATGLSKKIDLQAISNEEVNRIQTPLVNSGGRQGFSSVRDIIASGSHPAQATTQSQSQSSYQSHAENPIEAPQPVSTARSAVWRSGRDPLAKKVTAPVAGFERDGTELEIPAFLVKQVQQNNTKQ